MYNYETSWTWVTIFDVISQNTFCCQHLVAVKCACTSQPAGIIIWTYLLDVNPAMKHKKT